MPSDGRFAVSWRGVGRRAECPPDPKYPHGMEADLSLGARNTCTLDLPYPAPEIGAFRIECRLCGLRVGVTAAGRADDPRRVTIPCRLDAAGHRPQ